MKLDIHHLSKSFAKQNALTDVTLEIPDCKAVAFLGRSGSGKSTLLKLIAGLEIPDHGTVALDGKEIIYEEDALLQHRRSVGTVFQSWNLFPHFTALENISLPLQYVHGYSRKDAKELGMELLARFHLRDHADKKPAQLSGGQCQRVAIVRAVAIKPRLLLFDEPTSALDPMMTSEVLDLIAELKEEGSDFILVSHHMSFVKKIADWVVFVADGRIAEATAAKKFFEKPSSPAARHFLEKVLKY